MFFFFFQAEDGIRDLTVTGVQTCALPIYKVSPHLPLKEPARRWRVLPPAAWLLPALAAGVAAQAAATPLDSYLDDLRTLRARFLQTLVDAHGREIDRGTQIGRAHV